MDVNKKQPKYLVVPKKENRGRPHIVLVDGKRYCVHGKEALSKEALTEVETNITQSLLKKLHESNFSYVKVNIDG